VCKIVQVGAKTKGGDYFLDKISMMNDAIRSTTVPCRGNVNSDTLMLSIHFKGRICDVRLW